jgi:hypothetical protein
MSVALAACGGGDADVDAAADTSAATTTAATATDDASEAVATPVVYDTVTGGQIDLGALEGQDTVLWFWAPW